MLGAAVAARHDNATERRLTRISAGAHIERALRLAGRGAADLKTLDKAIAEAPHRFHATRDALYQAERAIETASWRITPPLLEEALLRTLAVQSDPWTLHAELAEFGWNVYLVLALAFAHMGARAPHLFGKLSVDEEAAQADAANRLVAETLAVLRSMPQIVEELAQRYGVQVRPGLDPTNDVFDAALALR